MLIIEVKPEAVEDRNQSMMSDVSTVGSAARHSDSFVAGGVPRKKQSQGR